jgi:hypothetical protein
MVLASQSHAAYLAQKQVNDFRAAHPHLVRQTNPSDGDIAQKFINSVTASVGHKRAPTSKHIAYFAHGFHALVATPSATVPGSVAERKSAERKSVDASSSSGEEA